MRVEQIQDYKPPFKPRLPKGHERFIHEEMPKYFIYNRFQKKAFCTACESQINYCWLGETLPIERTVHVMPKFTSRSFIKCPVCGKQVITHPHTSMLRSAHFFINFWNEKEKLRYSINYTTFSFDSGELPKETFYFTEPTGLGEFTRKNQRIMCESGYGYSSIGYVPSDISDFREVWFPNARAAIKRSFLRYNDIDRAPLNIKDMTQYLKVIAKYPQTEYLEKAGLEEIVLDKMYHRTNYIYPNWNASDLPGFLGIDQNDVNKLKQWGYISCSTNIGAFKAIRKHHKNVTKKMLETVINARYDVRNMWARYCRKQDPYKLCKYVEKQMRAYAPQCHVGMYGPSPSNIYSDYISQIKELGYNMNDEYNLYPPDLAKAHDRVSKEFREYLDKKSAEENKRKDAVYKKRLEKLSKWEWSDGTYLIRPLEGIADFKAEGRNNKNCVAGYFQKCADGKTNVFVIRRCDAPDTSYVTLELSNDKEIRQCEQTGNTVPPEEVINFAHEWLKTVVKKRKKGKKAA